MDLRKFQTFATMAASAAIQAKEQKNADPRLIEGMRDNFHLFGLAGLFEGSEIAQSRLTHYLQKMTDSRKIQDFTVVNSTKPSDLEKGNVCFDIAIKPPATIGFTMMQLHINKYGAVI